MADVDKYLNWWAGQHFKLVGTTYVIKPKDRECAETLLAQLEKPDLAKRSMAFLSAKTGWPAKGGRTLSRFLAGVDDPELSPPQSKAGGGFDCIHCGGLGTVEMLGEQAASCETHGGAHGLVKIQAMVCRACERGGFTKPWGSACVYCADAGVTGLDQKRQSIVERARANPSIAR